MPTQGLMCLTISGCECCSRGPNGACRLNSTTTLWLICKHIPYSAGVAGFSGGAAGCVGPIRICTGSKGDRWWRRWRQLCRRCCAGGLHRASQSPQLASANLHGYDVAFRNIRHCLQQLSSHLRLCGRSNTRGKAEGRMNLS